jgi:two-component system LytT family response regulator
MRVLLVDDEAPARRRLRRLLGELGEPGLEIVGEAASGLEALDLAARLAPDLVLLDVQMPELDGIAVAQALAGAGGPAIVFVTAHDAYAVRAFELSALDYVLKPVAAPRLKIALGRARRDAGLAARLPARPPLERLFVSERGRTVAVPLATVERIVAEDNYVRLCTDAAEHLHRATLTALAAVLDPEAFVRISRSAIVRVAAIRELVALGHGDKEVVLASGARLTWSRTYRPAARRRPSP